MHKYLLNKTATYPTLPNQVTGRALQRRRIPNREAGGPTNVPPIVHETLRAPGRPLDSTARAALEPRFGQDFSHVRVHTDAQAAESASSVNALAYTAGRDVVFGAGQYNPRSSAGQQLLAHELTHVAQQAGSSETSGLRIGNPSSEAEREAENFARDLGSGNRFSARAISAGTASSMVLQRQPDPGKTDLTGTVTKPSPSSMTIDRFELGKADLSEDQKKALIKDATEIKKILQSYPDTFITLVGHTDAVGAQERNQSLGQQRADGVLAELVANGVSQEVMHAGSLGESSLLVKTQAAEPRNRRVEIYITPRKFFESNIKITPSAPLPKTPNFQLPKDYPIGPGGPPPAFDWTKPIPPAPPSSDPIEDALDRDPLLRALPKILRDPIKGALKEGDETLADKAIDSANMDGKSKTAIKSAVKALLQMLKGKKWTPPTPSPYEMPPSVMPEMPKAPGEHIFTLPPIKWDFPSK